MDGLYSSPKRLRMLALYGLLLGLETGQRKIKRVYDFGFSFSVCKEFTKSYNGLDFSFGIRAN